LKKRFDSIGTERGVPTPKDEFESPKQMQLKAYMELNKIPMKALVELIKINRVKEEVLEDETILIPLVLKQNRGY